MEFVNEIIQNRASSQIGWSLLHSLWQGLTIYLVLRLILTVFISGNPVFRYKLYYAALVTQITWFSVTLFKYLNIETGSTLLVPAKDFSLLIPETTTKISVWYSVVEFLNQQAPLIFVLWVGGITFLTMRFLGGIYQVHVLKTQKILPVDYELDLLFNRLLERLNFSRRVRIFLSEKVNLPVAAGFLKPVVLIPIGFVNGLTQQQVESVLLHELAHIKRNDYLLNLLQSIVDIIFFFNPFTWLISRNIRMEREQACDDFALKYTHKIEYARALIATREFQANHSIAQGFHNGKNELFTRINRIMGKLKLNEKSHSFRNMVAYTIVLGMLALTLAFSNKNENTIDQAPAGTEKLYPASKGDLTARMAIFESVDEEKLPDESNKHVNKNLETEEESGKSNLQLKRLNNILSVVEIDSPEIDNQKLKKLVEEMKAHQEDWARLLDEDQRKLTEAMKELKTINLTIDPITLQELEKLRELQIQLGKQNIQNLQVSMMELREQMEQMNLELMNREEMKKMQEEMMRAQKEIKVMEEEIKVMEEKMAAAIKELREAAVNDGYLKSKSSEMSIDFEDDGIYINHQLVKKEHEEKYRQVIKKYFPREKGRFRIQDNQD
ncbi:MAG TPA: M56 family metallopeptidase [Cyclobacteriaceae bacterium]